MPGGFKIKVLQDHIKPPNYEVTDLSGTSKRFNMAWKFNFMCVVFSRFDRVCL